MWNIILNWLYGTVVGGLYFEFLLWLDRKMNKTPTRYLTPKEVAQINREYSKVAEGVVLMKNKVNSLLVSKSKEEYKKVLEEINDLVSYAEEKYDSPKAEFARILQNIYVKKGTKDINTHTEMAKMIDKRIQDTKEMWDHQAKRQLLRDIRKAGEAGDLELVSKLQTEFKLKYGRSNTRS